MADSSKSFSTSRSTFSQQPYSHQHLGTLAGADELGGLVSRLLALDPKATEENIAQVESLGLKPTTIEEPEAVPGWSEDVSIIQVVQLLISFDSVVASSRSRISCPQCQ
ncbi:hypothetical protein MJO29_008003 [Puccinia striiformis f. sp. tritici]|nr:hypothetical protein MJO29_008003 [Puccinia striiformis f. sp. tritici]